MKNILVLLCCVLLCACHDKKPEKVKVTQESLEKKQATGVVLIKNTYYYSIDFGSGFVVYFSGMDDKGNIVGATLDPNEIEPVTSFGTGFFVSKDGKIATNSHVASPSFSTKDARSAIANSFYSLAKQIQNAINEQNEQLGELRLLIDAGNTEYYSTYKELAESRDKNQELINAINQINSADCEYLRHCEIGIALNNTHVRNTNDFKECVTIADDPEHDLAIIQLKDKETPEKSFVFNVPNSSKKKSDRDDDDNDDADDEDDSSRKKKNKKKGKKQESLTGKTLYLIGFNLGPSLAITENGLKAQITKGEVSQDTDDTRFMYTIPALHGSSGSPVLDSYGKLVAVNYAGIDTTQGFNYGVKIIHLANLLNK